VAVDGTTDTVEDCDDNCYGGRAADDGPATQQNRTSLARGAAVVAGKTERGRAGLVCVRVFYYCGSSGRRHKNRITPHSIIVIFLVLDIGGRRVPLSKLPLNPIYVFYLFFFSDAKFPVGALRIIYPNGEAKKISRYCGTTVSIYFRGFRRTRVYIYMCVSVYYSNLLRCSWLQ
jgi:hypothetical protein